MTDSLPLTHSRDIAAGFCAAPTPAAAAATGPGEASGSLLYSQSPVALTAEVLKCA